MDSSDHPVVQRGIKAAELTSDVSKSLSGETLSLFTGSNLLNWPQFVCCFLLNRHLLLAADHFWKFWDKKRSLGAYGYAGTHEIFLKINLIAIVVT